MKPVCLTLICFLLFQIGSAQSPVYHWMNKFGGVENETGGFISQDKSGNIYTAVGISSSASFKPGTTKEKKFTKTTSASSINLVLTKVDAAGNLIWSKQFGDNVLPSCVITDNNDNVIISGTFGGTVDFDLGAMTYNLTSKDGGDIFFLKLSPKGDFIWAGKIGEIGIEQSSSIAVDKDNNLAVICQFSDTIDVDMSSSSVYNLIPGSSFETTVLKMDSSGKFLWAHYLSKIVPTTLCFDNSGNILTSGYFYGSKDFDFGAGVFTMSSSGSSSSTDAYIIKETSSGAFVWAKSFGEFVNTDDPSTIITDTEQNVIVAGTTGAGNSDFDPGPGVVNLVGNTNFILKLDRSGNYKWAKGIYGGTVPFDFKQLGTNDSSHVYVCGNFNVPVDFDPGPAVVTISPPGITDGFILRLDSNGIFSWVNQFKSTSSLYPTSFQVSTYGNLIIAGRFTAKADFDPTTSIKTDSSLGKNDIFTLKFSRCLSNSSVSLNECKHFTLAGHTFDSSEIIDVLFAAKDGCDSVVTVNFTAKKVNDTITVSGPIVSAKSTTGSSYQWVKCPSYITIPGATLPSYTVTVTGSYALVITENGCTDTSDCVTVIGLGIDNYSTNLFSVSPNPSKDIFNLIFAQTIQGALDVKSIDGRVIQHAIVNGSTQAIDLSNCAAGVYFLSITTSDGVQKVEKIIKD